MDVYMINLDRNADRLESFIEEYMMSDLRYKQFQRVTAVDGSSLDIKQYISNFAYKEIMQIEKTGYRTKHYQLTRGAIGCYLSHMKVYDLIATGDTDYGIVFEDDVSIDKNVLSKLNTVLTTMDDTWDIMLLGCHCIVCDKYETYFDIEKFFLLHGFVIKKTSAIKIMEILRNKKITQQIDSELSDMITQEHIKIYCLKTQLAKQQGFDTNIQTPLKVMPGVNPYTTLL
jgi:GR25 family glycosyltransferase involved in LPS biosynthesis